MDSQEFADQFDVLYNNITSNQAPGLDNYEKSVFLTKAQDEVLKSYFNPKTNKLVEGFDGNERRQIDFSMIMKTVKYTGDKLTDNRILDNKSNTKRITIEKDIMMFVNEFADVERTSRTSPIRLVVIPLGYKELAKLSNKPYKRPPQYQAWRVIDNANSVNQVEIIIGPNDTLKTYTIRYIKRPYPIILEDLTNSGVSIEGKVSPYNTNQACELDPILHEEILQRAVELAKAAYQGGLQDTIALGGASHTDIGIVPTSNGRQ